MKKKNHVNILEIILLNAHAFFIASSWETVLKLFTCLQNRFFQLSTPFLQYFFPGPQKLRQYKLSLSHTRASPKSNLLKAPKKKSLKCQYGKKVPYSLSELQTGRWSTLRMLPVVDMYHSFYFEVRETEACISRIYFSDSLWQSPIWQIGKCVSKNLQTYCSYPVLCEVDVNEGEGDILVHSLDCEC